jgi:glycosyltransferase involved in cell wall biosynthesis
MNPCGRLGGAETSLRGLLAGMRSAEPSWELWLVLGEDGSLADIARSLGAHVVLEAFPPALARIGDTGGRSLATAWALLRTVPRIVRYAWRLAACVREIKPDIVHTNGLKMHLLGAWTRPARTPLVWHIHDYVSRRRFMSRLLRLSRKRCTLAIANSSSVACDLRSLLPGVKVIPIHNAIDMERFSPVGNRLDLDAISGLAPAPANTVRVGLVATFARWKGHKVVLEALARVACNVPIRGYIIGAPIYQTDGSQWSSQELRQTADRLGLTHSVGFTGFVEDTAAAMRSLDIIVHASTEPEPFGMVIIEAMACGKVAIVSAAGGASELFTDGQDALAHQPGDVAGLAAAISRVASDRELRTRLGKTARATAERRFDGRRLARELLSVYGQVSGYASGVEAHAAMPSSAAGAINTK